MVIWVVETASRSDDTVITQEFFKSEEKARLHAATILPSDVFTVEVFSSHLNLQD